MSVKPLGVILAGGLARRMGGGDKSMLRLSGHSILQHVINRAAPQCSGLIINANGDPARFAEFGLPVVADVIPDHAGPLAGVLSGMDWAANNTSTNWIVTLAADTPFIPRDLVERLESQMAEEGAELACAKSNGRTFPVCGLWPHHLAEDLRRAMIEEDMRKVDMWTARHKLSEVEFSSDPVDPFFNVNRPEDMARAETLSKLLNTAHNHVS